MKLKLLGMSVLVLLFQADVAMSAGVTTVHYPITISVAADVIDLEAVFAPMHFGVVNLNELVFSNQPGGHPRCTLRNAGYADVNFTVSATITGGWELGTVLDDVGPNRCVIAGIFTQPLTTVDDPYSLNSRDLIREDFSDNDVLGPIPMMATSDQLARDSALPDPDDPENIKGYNVIAIQNQDIRSLRFMVQTPTQDDYATEQIFNIIIGAVMY